MATRHQVSCINKLPNHYDAHTRIQKIGGINGDNSQWTFDEDVAIQAIKDDKYSFYVHAGGRYVNVIIAKHGTREYLKTEIDNYSPDNLLSLPECP